VEFTAPDVLSDDNPLEIYKELPIITPNNPKSTDKVSNLDLSGMLIKTNDPNTLEKIRTYLTNFYASTNLLSIGKVDNMGDGQGNLEAWQMGILEPETVGEVAEIRDNDAANVARAVLAVIVLTLITAGCSLAVAVGGGLVEHKRPFTLLRVSGVSLRTLDKVILLESVVPLMAASTIAALIGLTVGIPVVKDLLNNFEPKTISLQVHPSSSYFLIMAIGILVALCLVLLTLPLLDKMTKPEEARFE
jgi:hypothetical protein